MDLRRIGVVAAAVTVLLWRLAAYTRPSSLVTIPDGLRLPVTLLGLLFLACGLVAWWLRPDRWTGVFLLYGLGGGVHWGGAIGVDGPGELSLLFVYLACSLLAETALLHLALIYPHGARFRRPWLQALYAPVAVALLLVPVAGVVSRSAAAPIVGLLFVLASLFSLAAAVIFVVRLWRADPATRRAARLPLIVTGLLAGGLLSLLGTAGLLPGAAEAWNLALGLLPICLAVALVTHGPLVAADEVKITKRIGEEETP